MITQQATTAHDIVSPANTVKLIFLRQLQSNVNAQMLSTSPLQAENVTKLSAQWNIFNNSFFTVSGWKVSPTTIQFSRTQESCYLFFDSEVLSFCASYSIYYECCQYFNLINEIFNNVTNITLSVSRDPEIKNSSKLRFVIAINDSVENVLAEESSFRKKLDHIIPNNKRGYFVYNYNIT